MISDLHLEYGVYCIPFQIYILRSTPNYKVVLGIWDMSFKVGFWRRGLTVLSPYLSLVE